ncbi:hypothetical protein ACIBAH_34810 [Streptomyces sp. NPDC051445]|uniref:hypothetical protein n=1 Tax=Streptomyces sp. NPDC051445 TaxID=3365653 RepID=UPI0037B67282
MADHVTEDTATHVAVGIIREPLDLRVYVYWTGGERGFRIVLKNEELTEEYRAWDAQTSDPIPGASLPTIELDRMVWQCLSPYRMVGSGWVIDPISLAAHFSTEWGWDWTTERFASQA